MLLRSDPKLFAEALTIPWLRDGDNAADVAGDCEAVSERWYGKATKRPKAGFATGPAFSDPTFLDRLRHSYGLVLQDLTYRDGGRHPTLDEAVAAVQAHRGLL